MSVLIRGMEMPENCAGCFMRFSGCEQRIYQERRPKGCPLVEVPTPHGRLVDADALMDGWMHLRDAVKYGNKNAEQQRHSYSTMMMYEIANEIDDAPTIIEAEE